MLPTQECCEDNSIRFFNNVANIKLLERGRLNKIFHVTCPPFGNRKFGGVH